MFCVSGVSFFLVDPRFPNALELLLLASLNDTITRSSEDQILRKKLLNYSRITKNDKHNSGKDNLSEKFTSEGETDSVIGRIPVMVKMKMIMIVVSPLIRAAF